MRQAYFLPILLLICAFNLVACGSDATRKREQEISTPRGAPAQDMPVKQAVVKAELAPFDRFPSEDKFPLVFRFERAVAPAYRESVRNFEKLNLTPHRPGSWSWHSDSELRFTPLDAWKPAEELEVSLKGLVTSDGTAAKGPAVAPDIIKVRLPEATASLSKCEFEIRHRAPLIQSVKIGLRFNYGTDGRLQNFWELKIKRADSEENLNLSAHSWGNLNMSVEAEGPKIFRPEKPATLIFRLKAGFLVGGVPLANGMQCDIPLDPATWDVIAERTDTPAERPLSDLNLTAPSREITDIGKNRNPLKVRFIAAGSTNFIAHGKAKGLILENGITMSPAIEGEWKSDEYDETALNFTPKSEWPVGVSTQVSIDPNIFPAVELRTTQATFKTPPLKSNFIWAALYTDPQNPSSRKIIGKLEFSHVPKIGEVERLLSISMRIEPSKKFDTALKFTSSVDEKSPRIIHIKSQDIDLSDEPGEVRLWLEKGALSAFGGEPAEYGSGTSVQVPSKREIFRVGSSSVSIVKTPDEKLQRVLSVETSEGVTQEVLLAALELYVLPDCRKAANEKICRKTDAFADETRVFPEVLDASERITLSTLPRDESSSPLSFHFSFEAPGKRELFLRVKEGLISSTGFSLSRDYRTVLLSEEFPKTVSIMHSGALLSLSGDKKLGVVLRNVTDVKFELQRILAHDVHHLVSASTGNFSKPYFYAARLGLDQFSERFNYSANFADRNPGESVYTTVDFKRFLGSAMPQGLFVLTVSETRRLKGENDGDVNQCDGEGGFYDRHGNYNYCAPLEPLIKDSRLVLLTDLGILVKDALNGDHEVFVMSFRSGAPVSGATVKLLGQNGIALFTQTTKADGRASFPSTKDLKQEKVPLVYVVEKGGDYSFLPFKRGDRQLNFSRFETEGVMNYEEAEGLRAMVFSDRGIYRPGEEARFGIVVRRRNLEPAVIKVPLEIAISDPRGIEIQRKKFALSEFGLNDYRWSAENALSGTYTLGIYLVRGEKENKKFLLGSTSFRVDEFQPDRLTVKTDYNGTGKELRPGWSARNGNFEVSVQNLFGTPAVANRVAGTLLIKPWDGTFEQFPEYKFYKSRSESELPQQAESLGEIKTDESGISRFMPDLSRFAERALRLEFAAEAFEKDSGRSVVSAAAALVSDSQHFVGWKADGSLDFISKAADRKVFLLAIDSNLKSVTLDGLKWELEETKMISTLVKQPNGLLQYGVSPKKTTVAAGTLSIVESGSEFSLNTANAGDYRLKLFNQDGEELNTIHYVVHGEGNKTFMAERKAEVGIRLSRSSVLPGEELEISINTPYVGAGLITIERDKIYAAKWFKADTVSSVQKITVPEDVIGNAYISVAFVRSLDSKEIFASPLSYGVKPFTIARSRYTSDIQLNIPAKVVPGNVLPVQYKLGERSKLLLYAVDEGILQFARYRNPEPVQSFVPKRALEVDTFQILDLIMPDQKIVSMLSAPGGDEDVGLGKFKNPFARKRRAPMAFWSGVIEAGDLEGTVDIPVPEYFNGTIRIIALAISQARVGAEIGKSTAHHDFVIDPQLPYFVSPGDEFEIGATVANTVVGSGKDVKLTLKLIPTDGLELSENRPIELGVPEGEDRSFRLKLRAKDMLGEQTVRISAEGLGRKAFATESMSIRAPHALRTSLQAGVYRPDKDGASAQKTLSPTRTLYSELRQVSGSISETPLSIGRSLIAYLKNYPYGCTEQLVSVAFPAVLFGADQEMGLSEEDVDKYTKRAFQALSARQRADGSFGLWDTTSTDDLFSVYAVHFLEQSNAASLEVPEAVLNRGKQWLKEFGAEERYDLRSQLAQAYALYIRAQFGEVVAKEAKALLYELDRQWGQKWRDSVITLFLAGTFKTLQMDEEGGELFKNPPAVWNDSYEWPISDAGFYGAVYAWIAARHFAENKLLSPFDTVIPLQRMVEDREFYSFNSAFSIMGLKALSDRAAETRSSALKIEIKGEGRDFTAADLLGGKILHAALPESIKELKFSGESGKIFFYELSESGFDRVSPQPVNSGVIIERQLKSASGELIDSVKLTDKLEVTLLIKADEPLSRMAVLELMPGGFEIDLSNEGLANRKSLRAEANSWQPAFIEIQEDRIIFFGDLPQDTVSFTYRLKPLSRGKYTFAAPYAEGMYDVKKLFLGSATQVSVE